MESGASTDNPSIPVSYLIVSGDTEQRWAKPSDPPHIRNSPDSGIGFLSVGSNILSGV
jgi:hypothetical protein